MIRSKYISPEEEQYNEKISLVKGWLLFWLPIAILLGLWVASNIMAIVWLQYIL